ncbi:MAG: ParA family protein [Aliarcobacter sp.]|jgi:chromosome partitioning protein|nr:ParA family protein [Aliarcobacter sp.]
MILLYSHQKGGVGKSTLAINHAYFKGCSIIDLDSQNSSMLFNQLRKMNDMKSIECFTADTVDEFKELVKDYKSNKENMIIIDSGGYDSEINRLALISADIIITPVGASQIELFGLQKFRNILNDASDATGTNVKTHVLINNVDSRSKKKISELREYIEKNEKYFNLLESVIHTRVDFKNAYGDGLTVKELDKESKATQEIKSLTKEIDNIIKNK